jgi:hypothetical protein
MLPDVKGPAENALQKLGRLPNAPKRIEERASEEPVTGRLPRSATAVLVNFDDWQYLGVASDDLERRLLIGAGTPPCIGLEPSDNQDQRYRETAARLIAGAWLAGGAQPLAGPPRERSSDAEIQPFVKPAWDALHALPQDAQRDRVAVLRSAALTCEGDLLDVLTQGAGR